MPLIVGRADTHKYMSIFRVLSAYCVARGSQCVSPRVLGSTKFQVLLLEPATPRAGLAPLIGVLLSTVGRGML